MDRENRIEKKCISEVFAKTAEITVAILGLLLLAWYHYIYFTTEEFFEPSSFIWSQVFGTLPLAIADGYLVLRVKQRINSAVGQIQAQKGKTVESQVNTFGCFTVHTQEGDADFIEGKKYEFQFTTNDDKESFILQLELISAHQMSVRILRSSSENGSFVWECDGAGTLKTNIRKRIKSGHYGGIFFSKNNREMFVRGNGKYQKLVSFVPTKS